MKEKAVAGLIWTVMTIVLLILGVSAWLNIKPGTEDETSQIGFIRRSDPKPMLAASSPNVVKVEMPPPKAQMPEAKTSEPNAAELTHQMMENIAGVGKK